MADQKQDNGLFSIVGGDEDNKHIFFHGIINDTSTFNFITNILGVKLEIDSNTKNSNFGFNQENDNQNSTEQINYNPKIIIHFSCPGGAISQAFIMADTIMNLNVPVYCLAEGIVASAGLIPFLACEKRSMMNHSSLYMHETQHSIEQLEYTNIDKFKTDAKTINNSLKDFYVERTGLSRKEVNTLFKTEKVLNSKDALENNFINASISEILA